MSASASASDKCSATCDKLKMDGFKIPKKASSGESAAEARPPKAKKPTKSIKRLKSVIKSINAPAPSPPKPRTAVTETVYQKRLVAKAKKQLEEREKMCARPPRKIQIEDWRKKTAELSEEEKNRRTETLLKAKEAALARFKADKEKKWKKEEEWLKKREEAAEKRRQQGAEAAKKWDAAEMVHQVDTEGWKAWESLDEVVSSMENLMTSPVRSNLNPEAAEFVPAPNHDLLSEEVLLEEVIPEGIPPPPPLPMEVAPEVMPQPPPPPMEQLAEILPPTPMEQQAVKPMSPTTNRTIKKGKRCSNCRSRQHVRENCSNLSKHQLKEMATATGIPLWNRTPKKTNVPQVPIEDLLELQDFLPPPPTAAELQW